MIDKRLTAATFAAVFVCCTYIAVPSSAADTGSDPTAGLVPDVQCDSTTCEEAATAFSNANYQQAGQLFASHFESAPSPQAGAWLVHAAYAHHLAQDWRRAADLYMHAADEIEPLRDYLITQAVRVALQDGGDPDLFERAVDSGALRAGYEDGWFFLAQLETQRSERPQVDTVEQALTRDDPDRICPWLLDQLADRALDAESPQLANLAHAHCIDPDWDDKFEALSYEPSSSARLQRANRIAGAVRFEDALAELDAIDQSELSPHDICRANFRRARSHFFLRQRQRAENIYRTIIDDCLDEANEDQRVRSLYAVGNRNYQRGRLDESERFFETLYREYPQRSHADDALFFLARIERQRDDSNREREVALLVEALEKYPHEDMIHEMAWEVYEPVYRGGDYRAFIDAVTALPLPDWDHEYFSQGRLEYFVGMAHQKLDEPDEATRYWQLGWVKYPFSFYGYLAHLRLLEQGDTPDPLTASDSGDAPHWFDDAFRETGAHILARTGHLAGACDFESARLASMDSNRRDRWRLATLCHQAGDYPTSHNIARRQISGRPWALPARGRLARWHVAWPDPYGAELVEAIETIGPSGEQRIHPGLATAIMREESSFIEDIISWAGAIGLMQLMPATARDHEDVIDGDATPERLKKAAINIPVAIDHIAGLSRRYDGHPVAMTAAYNAGAGRINGWLRRQPNDEIALWVEDIPILQTRNYTKRVIGSYAAYQYLQGTTQLDDRVLRGAR